MVQWTCPACGREFGRTAQSHVCAPAMSVDAYFARRPESDRAIFEAVAGQIEALGPVVTEAVEVGIFFKRRRTFAELRPRRKGMALSLMLARRVDHPAISRTASAGSDRRIAHFIPLTSSEDVSPQVCAWIAESYFESEA